MVCKVKCFEQSINIETSITISSLYSPISKEMEMQVEEFHVYYRLIKLNRELLGLLELSVSSCANRSTCLDFIKRIICIIENFLYYCHFWYTLTATVY